MDYENDELAVDSATQPLVVYLLDQQRVLLYSFLEHEQKRRGTHGKSQPRSKEKSDESEAIEIPAVEEEEIVRKARSFLKRSQGRPERMRWGAYNTHESTDLVEQLVDLNRKMHQALEPDQIKELHRENKRTVEQFMTLNSKSQTMAQIIVSGSRYSNKASATNFSDRESEEFEYAELKFETVRRFFQATRGSTVVGSEVAEQSMLPQHTADRTIRGTELSIRDMYSKDGLPFEEGSILEDIEEDERTEAIYKNSFVWIEWKVEEDWIIPRFNESVIEERVNRLSAMLEMNSNDPYQFCLPRGLGYFRDEENGRFGLVFEKPQGTSEHAAVNLRSLFLETDKDGDIKVPSLTDRIVLMRILSETVERLHAVDWQHQGLRSANVLFFRDPKTHDIDYANPYVSGFHYSRPATRDDMTERPSQDIAAELYRHPFAQHFNNMGFSKSHDIYALGLILLEIAYWKPLDQILGIDLGLARPKTVYKVRERLLRSEPKLLQFVRSQLGTTVEHIIRICLIGPEAFGLAYDIDEKSREVQAMLQREFSEQVVAKLAEIRGL